VTRSRTLILVALGSIVAALGLTACSKQTRDKILPIFFDMPGSEEASARPPTRRVRRDLLREIDDLKRGLAEAQSAAKAPPAPAEAERPVERAKTWDEARATLPKDASGAVDWGQALKDRTIAPRAGPEADARAQAVLDLDVELASSGSRVFSSQFSHAPHTEWLACSDCHPAIFPLGKKAAPVSVTMARIAKGEYCGACHGTVAFGVEGRCARCHRAIPATSSWRPAEPPAKPIEGARTWSAAMKLLPVKDDAPDWQKALADGVIAPRPGIDPRAKEEDVLDLDVVRADGAPHKVVFSHAAHTAWLVCDTCHPAPYEQEAGKTRMSMDRINEGQLCGSCHGTVAFPLDACSRCHPAMGG
jgi:c(7)-type cytochrome triheme protein